jgi:hypothetical protein
MFQLFKKGGRKVGGLLLGIQILVVFLIPINVAYAQTTVCPWDITTIWGCMGSNAGILASSAGSAVVNTIAAPLLEGAGKVGMEILIFIASLFFKIAQLFFVSMAIVLDLAISSTISTVPYKIATIAVAWTAVRDLSNMFFIFVLLFIAIQTILGLAGGSAKRWLSHVIIAALLINFSLFLTGVVIDAGNILAMGFWNKMTTTQGTVTGPSVSMQLMQGLKLQTASDPKDPSGKPIEQIPQTQLLAYIGGTLVSLIAGYVFLAGAVMMIIRTVTLMILMIVSPFAFLGFALPKGGGFANTWLTKLIGNTFVAPAFLAMLYIDSLIINSTDLNTITGGDPIKMGAAFGGNTASLPIIYHYILVIILILASLKVANEVSSGAGSAGGAWAKKIIGGGAAAGFAGAGWYGRQTIGSTAQQKMKDENWVKEQERLVKAGGMKGRMANLKLATAQKAAKGSFDIRNAPMGGLGVTAGLSAAGIKTGTGSKKSFATHGEALSGLTGRYRGTEKEKELIATAKERFPNNSAAQKAWLEQRGVELNASDGRNKEVNETLNKGINAEENKKTAEAAVKEHEKQLAEHKVQKQALAGFKQQEAADIAAGRAVSTQLVNQITATTASMKTVEDKMTAEAVTVRKSFQNMSADDVAKLMEKDEYRNSKVVRDNLSAKDYTAINKRFSEGGYKGMKLTDAEKAEETRSGMRTDSVMMKNITENALANKNVPDSANRVVKNQMKNGTWGHEINFKQEVAKIVAEPVKDAQGNYIAKATLTKEEKAQLKELRSMMDHEDVASLDNSLLLNQHIARDFSPATIAAVNKKQKEKGGDTDTAFVNAFRDVTLRHGNERTVESIVKNTGNKESFLYDNALQHKYTPAYTARLKELKAEQNNGPLPQASAQQLSTLNLTTAAIPQIDPKERAKRLRELYAMGDISGDPALTAELKQLEQQA